jgi:hypothetical protein
MYDTDILFVKQKINYKTVEPRHTALPLVFMWDTTLFFSVLKLTILAEVINTLLLHLLLDCPEIKSRCRQDFLQPSTPALRPTHPPIQWIPGHSRG